MSYKSLFQRCLKCGVFNNQGLRCCYKCGGKRFQ